MKILIIHNTTYPPEIGKTDILYYLKYLGESFEKCDLFCSGKNIKLANNVNIYGSMDTFKKGILKDLELSIKSAVFFAKKRNEYDTVYILNPLFFGIIPALLAKSLGKKIVFDLRTGPITNHQVIAKIVILLDSLIISIADKIIFINKDIYYKRGYFGCGKKMIHETLLGFEKNIIEKNNRVLSLRSRDKKAFIYIGTLGKRRQLSHLIEAFNSFGLDAELFILGSGDDEMHLRSIAKDTIFFLGQCPHELVPSYIQACDFGVSFIPINEQYDLQPPLKTIEYLGYGKPVLATNSQGNNKFINKENGVIIDNYLSQESISNAIRQLLDGSFQESEIIEGAEKYEWAKVLRRIIEFLNIQKY